MARKLDNKPGSTLWAKCGSVAITSAPRFVKLESGLETIILASVAGEAVLGVQPTTLKAAEDTAVILDGICLIELGDTVADQAEVSTDTVGRAVTATSGQVVCGTLLKGGAVGEIGSIRLGVRKAGPAGTTSLIANGTAVLSSGTKTVNTALVATGDKILLTRLVTGGTVGNLTVGTITNGTSFVITSDSASETSTIAWLIVR